MLIDNRKTARVADVLADHLGRDCRFSVLTNGFSIYAYAALEKVLSRIAEMRLLVPAIDTTLAFKEKGIQPLQGLLGSDVDRAQRNQLNQIYLSKSCAEWLAKKTEVRGLASSVPHNIYHITKASKEAVAIHGSSPFTTAGLGLATTTSFDMNTFVTSKVETDALLDWFELIWRDGGGSSDIKDLILQHLRDIYSDKPAERIYFLTLYHLFNDLVGEIDEGSIIKTRTGIKETKIWKRLYRFQRDGVLGAIDKIERYNGCIIADSVGLGKTLEALAIIKYYELRNDRVLVLCPKKLRENWAIYTINDRRNIFAEDRFNYDVLNHTDLTRIQGKSGEINLATINWGNYDLVVIDESHNFRNSPPRKDGLTRYRRLMNEIIRSGVKTKVLMLSATPVNSRMNDLKNQVAFITEGEDDALYDNGIFSIEATLRKAQTKFSKWLDFDEEQRTPTLLLEMLDLDYFKLLDLLTIARSRKHIQKYYDMQELGEFPERLKPVNHRPEIDTEGLFPPLKEVNRSIRRLNLSAYAPLKYVRPDKLEEYSRRYDMEVAGGSVFKQIDREESLIHLMRVNLFKRMESSIEAFRSTLGRLLEDVRDLIERLDQHDPEVEELNIEDIEIDDDEFEPYLIGDKIKVLITDIDQIRWRQELKEDEDILVALVRQTREITPERDAKLHTLRDIITSKTTNPINPGNKKILVFTAFADTANYLYKHLATWAKHELNIHSAIVTGRTGDNQSTIPSLRRDLITTLMNFSPVSMERGNGNVASDIDLLIATDCISEGQNLQDCDYVINYDIHWNPVRIIQRFGRIDRLGSLNKVIQLVNFWPNMELEEYINLRRRVTGRMVLLDISATGEENLIADTDLDKMNDLEYRRRQLEQLMENVIDFEDLSTGISISDLTLNDFRMDLSNYVNEHKDLLENTPAGSFAVVAPDDLVDEEMQPGVIFCLKSVTETTVRDASYPLAPHYLVYVHEDGEVALHYKQAKQILDHFKRLSIGRHTPDTVAMARFNGITADASDMAKYQDLLAKAIAALTGMAEERGVESLFHRGGTAVTRESFRGIEDFEIISWLVILPREEEV